VRNSHRITGILALALLAGIGVGLAVVPPSESPWFPGCRFRDATGLACPGCGGTRAVHAALNGRIAQSISLNVIAIPLLLLAVYPFVRFAAKGIFAWNWWPLPRAKAFWIVLATIVIGFGIVRNLPGFPFPLAM
jgi:hypothetical protein